ncbi:MAG: hypothetical protein ACRD21_10595, partial [Vicinamibacteria bacterium]
NAVPETQVFGHRAGVSAAGARANRSAGRIDDRVVHKWRNRLQMLEGERGSVPPELDALAKEQRAAIGVGLGIIRSGSGLRKLLSQLDSLRERQESCPPKALADLMAAVELEDVGEVATACAASALLREESRAAHYREDFPGTDPAWVRTVFYQNGRAFTRPLERDPNEEEWSISDQDRAPVPEDHVE